MKDVFIGDKAFRVAAVRRGDRWVGFAERGADGRVGPECAATTEHEAIDMVEAWLTWQHEHAEALGALQQAERAYHRTIAGSAFASPVEGPSPIEIQKEALGQVEAARVRLDEVRARQPQV